MPAPGCGGGNGCFGRGEIDRKGREFIFGICDWLPALAGAGVRGYSMLELGKRGGRSWVRAWIAFSKIHAFNEAVRNGVNVPHVRI